MMMVLANISFIILTAVYLVLPMLALFYPLYQIYIQYFTKGGRYED